MIPTFSSGRLVMLIAGALLMQPAVHAASITVDGKKDDAYGAPVAVQAVNTSAGNSTDSTVHYASGSELAAAYAHISDGKLYLLFTGNIKSVSPQESHKLNILIDTGAGGGMNQLQSWEGQSQTFTYLTQGSLTPLVFDKDFAPQHWFTISPWSKADKSVAEIYVSYANLVEKADGFVGTARTGVADAKPMGGQELKSGSTVPSIQLALDNSNTAGVEAGTAAADTDAAKAVDTGLEIVIPLADLGNPTQPIKITAFIASGNNSMLFNQFLAPLPAATDSLGGATGRAADLNKYDGKQYVTITPPEHAPSP